jgi:hypothetical protein
MQDENPILPDAKRTAWNKGKLTGANHRSWQSTSGRSGPSFRSRSGPAIWPCSIWLSHASTRPKPRASFCRIPL